MLLCVCVVWDYSTGRVGAPLVCCEIQLKDWTEGETHTHTRLVLLKHCQFSLPQHYMTRLLKFNSGEPERERKNEEYLQPCKEVPLLQTNYCSFTTFKTLKLFCLLISNSMIGKNKLIN